MRFLEVYVGYAIFGTAVFSAFFVWAVRARQFSDLKRGASIPLEAGEPVVDERAASRVDKYALVVLAAVTAGLLGAALWIGYRNG